MVIEYTVAQWAKAWGIEHRTLQRKLAAAGYTIKPKEKVPLIAFGNAILGEKAAAEVRLKTAQAADQERKNRIADGETITLAANLAWQDKVLMPIRQRLLSMSGTVAHLCNPTDPVHAAATIDRWVNETLSMLRAEIGKVKE